MTERENFLERWSRRKTDAARDAADTPAPARADTVTPPAPPAADATPAVAPKPEFDLSQLPSLESITSATDIRAFLTPGVPQDLTRAALRRAWAADPAIRDFVGLAENAWDFTDPNAIPGFGEIPIGYDIRKMVAEVFGELDKAADQPVAAGQAAATTPTEPAQIASESKASALRPEPPTSDVASHDGGSDGPAEPPPTQIASLPADVVPRDEDAAAHNKEAATRSLQPRPRRPHGRALPEV